METEEVTVAMDTAPAVAPPGDAGLPGAPEVAPGFPELSAAEMSSRRVEMRRFHVPPNRMTPLKENWKAFVAPVAEQLKLQIRYNTKERTVDIRTSSKTLRSTAMQKASDYIQAFLLGFEIQDAVALIRLEDIFLESFQVEDVKELKGDHLSRAIGRIAGQNGKTRFTIENATRTRIVLADHRIHLLGTYQNIAVARNAICSLILGAPPGKIFNKMKSVAARAKERF